MTMDEILNDAWNDLVSHYKSGQILLNEEDMRCLLYHLCAKRLTDLNQLHSQKRIAETKRETYDLVLGYPQKKQGVAVELKCWLWKSSGTPKRDDVIRNQLRRLENAIESKRYDRAYLFVLDEFDLSSSLLRTLSPTKKEIQLKYFSPTCVKTIKKWGFEKDREPCLNCEVKIPCRSNQGYIREWQSKGYLL